MKLLLAEDTEDLNHALTTVLEMQGYAVDAVFDGQEAIEQIERNAYDGILLDIMMPRKSGLEVLEELRAKHIVTPVLLLTAKAEVEDRVAGLDAGADDYLPKPFAMKELLARVRAMTRRAREYAGRDLTFGDLTMRYESLELSAGNTVRLSIKEYELMQALLRGAGEQIPEEQLLGTVWADDPKADGNTLWLYISYLRGKLRAIGSVVKILGERGGSFGVAG